VHYRIGVLPGDDIGLEVVPGAVRVLQEAVGSHPEVDIEWVDLPIGYTSYMDNGYTLPSSTIQALYGLDGWILGPIGHMAYPKDDANAVNPHPIIRKRFELHSNIRPCKSYPAVDSLYEDVDLVIVRENNEGFQPDRNVFAGSSEFMPSPDMAISARVITRANSSFVAKTAFELARERSKGKVTAVHKDTVFKLGCGLFAEACRDVSVEYPRVQYGEEIVDTFALKLVRDPLSFDTVVTTNLFGDILTDLAAGLVGGLGMAPGLCVGPEYAMAQATHGSAPDIAGGGIANPFAIIMSSAMLLSWLGNQRGDESAVSAGNLVAEAAERTLENSSQVTPDIGGEGNTETMVEAVRRCVGKLHGA